MWGDADFNWDMLDDAMHYMYGRFSREALLAMYMKEKYGTIRYEFWYPKDDSQEQLEPWQVKLLLTIILDAATVYSEVAKEIVDDIVDVFDWEYNEDYSYYYTKFTEILDETNE
jgi:hypothetical protein